MVINEVTANYVPTGPIWTDYRMDDHELDHKLDIRRLSEVSISRCAKTMPQRIFANGLVQNWRMPHFFLSGEHEVLNHWNWGVTQFSDTEAVM